MNERKLIRRSGVGVLAVALAGLAPGLARADNFVGTDFQKVAGQAMPSASMDYSGYEKLNLSVLGNTQWVPKTRGAEGPLRTDSIDADAAARAEAADRDLQMHLGPIGGRNTP